MRTHDHFCVFALERRLTGQHVKECRAKTVLIATRIDWQSTSLFWAHVKRRAHDFAASLLVPFDNDFFVTQLQRQAEIGELHHSAVGDHDVIGLDIPVNNSLRFGVNHGFGHAVDDLGNHR